MRYTTGTMKFSAAAVSVWMTDRPLMLAANTEMDYTNVMIVNSSRKTRAKSANVKTLD